MPTASRDLLVRKDDRARGCPFLRPLVQDIHGARDPRKYQARRDAEPTREFGRRNAVICVHRRSAQTIVTPPIAQQYGAKW